MQSMMNLVSACIYVCLCKRLFFVFLYIMYLSSFLCLCLISELFLCNNLNSHHPNRRPSIVIIPKLLFLINLNY